MHPVQRNMLGWHGFLLDLSPEMHLRLLSMIFPSPVGVVATLCVQAVSFGVPVDALGVDKPQLVLMGKPMGVDVES